MNEGRNQMQYRIAPGMWVDMDNKMHISVPELLEVFHWPDTPENRQCIFQAASDLAALHGAKLIYRDKPD